MDGLDKREKRLTNETKEVDMSSGVEKRIRVSRREFVKGAAVGAGALAGTSVLASCSPAAAPAPGGAAELPATWDKEVDVVVVGGGGAGCNAAMSAAEAGASVVLLEVAPALGGESSLCVGSVSLPLSSLQKEQGISDTVEAYVEDVIKAAGSSGARSDQTLVKWLGENAGPTIDWMIGLGVELRGPFEYPNHRVSRMHMLYPTSAAWPKVLGPALEAKGVEILLQTKGVELYATCDNRVAGVKAVDQVSQETINIKAKRGVVLAAGDLTGSEQFKLRFTTPEQAAVPAAHAFNDGSGLLMGMAVGADLTRLDSWGSAGVKASAPGPDVSVTGKQVWMPYGMMDAGAILVNKEGARFVNETDSSKHGTATMEQPDQRSFMVYDDVVAQLFNEWPMVVSSCPGIGDVSGLGGWGTVDDFIARNGIKTGDTIEALAGEMGIDPAGLKDAIEKWNQYAEGGEDPDFGRKTFGHPDAGTVGAGIKVAPFYCHGPLKPENTLADCSLAVNTNLQVLDPYGEPIPGLYAGGNMGHGMMIAGGHGTHMAWCFTSGRHAGQNVAAEEPWE